MSPERRCDRRNTLEGRSKYLLLLALISCSSSSEGSCDIRPSWLSLSVTCSATGIVGTSWDSWATDEKKWMWGSSVVTATGDDDGCGCSGVTAGSKKLEGREMMDREARGSGECAAVRGGVCEEEEEGLNSSKLVMRQGSAEDRDVDLGLLLLLLLPAALLAVAIFAEMAGRANPTWCSAELFAGWWAGGAEVSDRRLFSNADWPPAILCVATAAAPLLVSFSSEFDNVQAMKSRFAF